MKDLLTKALQFSVPILPFSTWQRLCGENLILPFYHLVSDESLPHVRHLYPIRTAQQFREDLDFLLKHFQPVDFQSLWEHVFENRPFESPVFHLTFDDGLRECHDVIM
ncbi:MAG: polysaccharide deacetylase, partial [Saprospiraceae bacterium]|nr:polysaccharide deacetylase [Saprospiraceae bacterium]